MPTLQWIPQQSFLGADELYNILLTPNVSTQATGQLKTSLISYVQVDDNHRPANFPHTPGFYMTIEPLHQVSTKKVSL